eukprot:TRINITY_DN86_c0_g1_i4.p1 TRINITY_DN86_c0_g1~~TRINITY_DN86_c0_g1_i4.p1  ORF type:complete len:532 (-),score=118.22 TRINITY_DN86_c0_g1_i4:40-1635(-)
MASKMSGNVKVTGTDTMAKVKSFFLMRDGSGEVDMNTVLLFGVSILCVILPLELGQITFAVIGAAVYAVVQAMRQSTKAKLRSKARPQYTKASKLGSEQREARPAARVGLRDRSRPAPASKKVEEKLDYRQPSVQPVMAPSFRADAFDVQIQELLELIKPSPQSDRVMRALAGAAKRSLRDLLPDAEVMAFASGDVMRGTAFGVAVPEVDIILNAEPNKIADQLRVRTARPLPRAAQLDAQKLQKAALRACTDDLVAGGVFKFRRSAFKGMEPKVTLLATGFGSQSIPVDFSVNTVAPLYNAALLTECGQVDPRARDLILLVRRWAKDRGVSHAAKGHLSPYAWTLLATYFMQVREDQDGPSLTKLKAFTMSKQTQLQHQEMQPRQLRSSDAGAVEETECPAGSKTVAALFKEFFHFYACSFDWRNEGICVRTAKRVPPSSKLPLHIVVLEDGTSSVAPSIADPFEPSRNLGSMMTAMSLSRLLEEFARADRLCSHDVSLSELLEPWVPPERNAAQGTEAKEDGSECAGDA